MKYKLLFLMLLFATTLVYAQEDEPRVTRLFTVQAPPGYVNTHTVVNWSPDGRLIAVPFNIVDERKIPIEALWQVYDVETGEKRGEYSEFIAWYTDSHRALVHLADHPFIVDFQTVRIIASVDGAGETFLKEPIDDVILNRDKTDTLRLYDANTGILRFVLGPVTDFPIYSPDRSQFAVHTQDSGIAVYSAEDFSELYRLDGYDIISKGGWSPDGKQITVVSQDASYYDPGSVRIWTPGEGLSEPLGSPTRVIAWSLDGTQLAVAHDPTEVGIYDAATGDMLTILEGYTEGPTTQLHWERQYLVRQSGSHADVTLALNVWDFESRTFIFQSYVDLAPQYWFEARELVVLEPFYGLRRVSLEDDHTINMLRFERPLFPLSPDHRWAIATNFPVEDGNPVPMYLYQLNPLMPMATLEGHIDIVNVYWSPDNRHFASVGGSGTVILWAIDE